MDDVMTCAKIISGFDASCLFLVSISSPSDGTSTTNPWYLAIYESGKILGFDYLTMEVSAEYELGFCPRHALTLNPTTVLLCSDAGVVCLTRNDSSLTHETLPVPDPTFTFELPAQKKGVKESFGVYSRTGTVFLYKDRKCVCEVAFPAASSDCFCVIPGDKPIFITAAPELTLVKLAKKSKLSRVASIQNVKKIVALSNLTVAIISNGDLRLVQFNKDLSIASDELLMTHTDEISDLVGIDENSVIGCSGPSAFVCPTEKARSIVSATLRTVQIERFVPIVTMSGPDMPCIYGCLCDDGSIALVRIPADRQEKKKRHMETPIKMETVQLHNFNRSRIRLFASARDQSYLTISENGKVVLWESLADWWTAPHFCYFTQKDDPSFLGY